MVLFASLVALAGCSSFDRDVIPVIVSAEIAVDRDLPDELAQSDIAITFDTDGSADRIVELYNVLLVGSENGRTPTVSFALPPDFDGRVRHGAEPELSLVNVGTTNGLLAPLCGETGLEILVNIHYAGTETITFNDPEPMALTCR